MAFRDTSTFLIFLPFCYPWFHGLHTALSQAAPGGALGKIYSVKAVLINVF